MTTYRLFTTYGTLVNDNYVTDKELNMFSTIEVDGVEHKITLMSLHKNDNLDSVTIDVYIESKTYCYKITFSNNDDMIYSADTYPTKKDAYQAMLKDALKCVNDFITDDYEFMCFGDTKIETTETTIKVHFCYGEWYLYEIFLT